MLHRAADAGFWPDGVVAVYSDRLGGVSLPPYDSFNLGDHVGDSAVSVADNRQRLIDSLDGCDRVQWLQQVHGTEVLRASHMTAGAKDQAATPEADAAISCDAGLGLAVMTADCLPLLISDASGDQLAAVHAGWRGLLDGVIESAVDGFGAPADQLRVWLGPCIGAAQFEVGAELRSAFLSHRLSCDSVKDCFRASLDGRYLADLKALAQLRLQRCGVKYVAINADCTVERDDRYFSYRRDGQCGRMVSLIYRKSSSR